MSTFTIFLGWEKANVEGWRKGYPFLCGLYSMEVLPFTVGDPCPRCGAPVESVELQSDPEQPWKRMVFAIHGSTRCRVGSLYLSPYGSRFRLRAVDRSRFLAALQPYRRGDRCPICRRRIADIRIGWRNGVFIVSAVHDWGRSCCLGDVVVGKGWKPSPKLARKLDIPQVYYKQLNERLWIPAELLAGVRKRDGL